LRRARGRAALAAALALASPVGCGSASEEDYAAAVDRFCAQVRGSVRQFEDTATAAGARARPQAATRAFGGAVQELARDLRRATDALRDAEAPGPYADWSAGALRGFGEAARRLDGVAARARSGDPSALSGVERRLGDLDVAAAPPGLRERAPSCRA
jgi:hypothetical protein